jgi:hypothetical protein
MKKTISLFILLACIIGFSSCGMKNCKCYSTNVITRDTIIQNETDTVNNSTRGSCEEFNKDETMILDSVTNVHHIIFCEED